MKSIITILSLLIALGSFSQYDIEEVEKDSVQKETKVNPFTIKEKIYVGGEMSVRFGSLTYLYLAPFAGYDFYKGFSAGVSSMYQLYRAKYTNGAVISSHSYGGGLFMRYRPESFNFLLLQTELNLYNTEDIYGFERVNVPSFMAGGGYAGSMGDRAYYQIMLMYDFIDDDNMPLIPLFNIPIYLRYGFVFYLG